MGDASDTYVRTVTALTPELSAKKAGMINRAMKDYHLARELTCEHFRTTDADPTKFTYSERENLRKDITNHPQITLNSRTVYPAITTVEQNYSEFIKDQRASPPQANRADVLGLEAQATRMFFTGGQYYLNINTGIDWVPIPLLTSGDEYHADRLPHPDAIPDMTSPQQRVAGVKFDDLDPDAFPADTVKLGTSTLTKVGDRRFRANLVFQIEKRIKRTGSLEDTQYVIGVDRGRNHLVYACVYDRETAHVVDWWNRKGDEVEHRMDQLTERISNVQQSGAINDILRLRVRRRRYKRQIDYEIANALIRLARERLNPVIVLEDLSGMSNIGNYTVENRRFNDWSYYRLGEYIQEKAEPYEIPVETVPPGFTSRTCSRCGEDERTSRSGVHFECDSCGYEQNADANASVNTAKKFVETANE